LNGHPDYNIQTLTIKASDIGLPFSPGIDVETIDSLCTCPQLLEPRIRMMLTGLRLNRYILRRSCIPYMFPFVVVRTMFRNCSHIHGAGPETGREFGLYCPEIDVCCFGLGR